MQNFELPFRGCV